MDDLASQTETKPKNFSKDPEKVLWSDTSIEIKSLSPSEIAKECSNRSNRSQEAWRQEYYRWKDQGYDDWWLDKYKHHFKRNASAKVYKKLDSLLDNARFIKDVVQAGEFLDGKDQGGFSEEAIFTWRRRK